MKPKNGRIVIAQVCLILMMSAAAAYGIVPITGSWTILLIGVLLLTGVLMILFPRIGALPFSLLTFVASLPAILTHNIIDIGKFTYQDSFFFGSWSSNQKITFEISYWAALGIGLFLISGYLVLSYLNSLQKEYQATISGDADIPETQRVTSRNIIMVVMLLVLAGLFAALLFIPLNAIQPVIAEFMKNYSWSTIVFGLTSILLLARFVYLIGVRRKS